MVSSGLVDAIWVTGYQHAPTLAAGLREAVTTAWRHKLANAGRDDAAAKVYDYVTTGGFADRYAAAERALDAQLETLREEKPYYSQSWAQREQQIEKTRLNLGGMPIFSASAQNCRQQRLLNWRNPARSVFPEQTSLPCQLLPAN